MARQFHEACVATGILRVVVDRKCGGVWMSFKTARMQYTA
jgi:hypothetical protein